MTLRINEWSKLVFSDPEEVIIQYEKVIQKGIRHGLSDKLLNLRTNRLKDKREGWIAAVFCYGMQNLIKEKVYLSIHEKSDYDIICLIDKSKHDPPEQIYVPLQIKESVPPKLDPSSDPDPIREISNDLANIAKKYADSRDLCLLLYINRNLNIDVEKDIHIPSNLNVKQLWFLVSASVDRTKYALFGDCLKDKPNSIQFTIPI